MKCPKCGSHNNTIIHGTGRPTRDAIIIETQHKCSCGHEWTYGRRINEPWLAPVYYRSFVRGGNHA